MVDILIDGITTIEAWEALVVTSTVDTVVIAHAQRHVVTIDDNIAIGIDGHRSSLAFGSELTIVVDDFFLCHADDGILEGVVVVLVDTVVLESIDGTERVVQLHALQVLTIGIAISGVLLIHDVFIHLQDLIAVVTEVCIDIHRELACLNDAVGVDVEFPTRVAHLTIVMIGHSLESRVRRNAEVA